LEANYDHPLPFDVGQRMITFSLQSGSNGNCIYVEAGGVRLLFDAGISGKIAEGRMRAHGREIRDVQAVLLSHDHSDHVRCAGIFQRKFKVPILMTRRTHAAIGPSLGETPNVRYFEAGESICFGQVRVHTLRTPHDAVEGVGFIVEHEGRRLGILTDLGNPFRELRSALGELDAVYLESNYDPKMLETGRYPWQLQQRIRGSGGHLSNGESAELLRAAGSRLRWAALAHLSEENNTPELALDTHRARLGLDFPLHVAPRYGVSSVFEI
jgi:phosphoribosyl 1,2-cyclic phosphodiesterase